MINTVLAQQVLDRITAAPDRFNMGSWYHGRQPLAPADDPECGTTLCIAGWAAHLSGYTLLPLGGDEGGQIEHPTDPRGDIHEVAAWLLGLTEDDATQLFYADNSRHGLAMLRQVVAGHAPNWDLALEEASA